jgi:hypothetical protein
MCPINVMNIILDKIKMVLKNGGYPAENSYGYA